jgi:Fur family peroxide stress response transcriptional regulator
MEKKTRQKEAILKVLQATRSHPTADWVYREVRKELPNISLGTVYRNLRILSKRGEILELDLSGSLSRFDCNTEDHYHFRCDRCAKIFDLDEAVDKEINERIAQSTGFWITHHRLEFRGLCMDCQKNWLAGK